MSKANDKISPAKRKRILELKKSISVKRKEQEELSLRLTQLIRTVRKHEHSTTH